MRVDITVELRATPDNTMRERAIITTNGCGRGDHSHSQKTLEDLGSELRARVGEQVECNPGVVEQVGCNPGEAGAGCDRSAGHKIK